MTTRGFFSAVGHRDHPDVLIVRARAREDVEALCADLGTEPVESPDADYPYRTVVGKQTFADWLRDQTVAIDYPNFKDAVADRQGLERASVYSQVWAALRQLSR